MLNHPTLTAGVAWYHGLTHPVLAPLRPRHGILQPCLGRHIDHVPRHVPRYRHLPQLYMNPCRVTPCPQICVALAYGRSAPKT
jgi:hypothetical protein